MEIHRLSEAKADFDFIVDNFVCEIDCERIKAKLIKVAASEE